MRHRVPILLQMHATECGAACLAMILGYFGRKTSVAECWRRLGSGRDGCTARELQQAASSFGLRVRAFSVEPESLAGTAMPVIVHWKFAHFLVLERYRASGVDLVDPAVGRVRMSLREFDEGFTGVVLRFEADSLESSTETRTQRKLLNHIRQALKGEGMLPVLAQILLASVLLQLMSLASPLLTKILIDGVLPQRSSRVLEVIGLALAGMAAAQLLASYLRSCLVLRLQSRLDMNLTRGFLQHVLRLPYRFFQERSLGDLHSRLISNNVFRDILTNQVISSAIDAVMLVGTLIVLVLADRTFAVVVLLIALLQAGIMLATSRRMQRATERELVSAAETQSYLMEMLAGVATLKGCGAEQSSIDRWSGLHENQLHASFQKNHLNAIVNGVLQTIRTGAPLLLLWIGAKPVIAGLMSPGTLVALTGLSVSFLTPLSALVSTGLQWQAAWVHSRRIENILEEAPEPERQQPAGTRRLTGSIQVRHVGFRYSANGPWVLRNIDFSIPSGKKVALVGRTGSGKSTLAKLLLGLYQPTEGEIFYDGISADRFDCRELRRNFGVVLQEPFLFRGTIRQNVAFSDPGMPLNDVARAARLAAIENDIRQMPMRFETVLAEGGSCLSGGQRQRIALARALAHRPVLLLLDEASSNLDETTEREVEQNLSQLNCTRVVVAHRLSTIRDADLILVLDRGEIVEQGTHAELLAREGVYCELVESSQISPYPAPHAWEPLCRE